jgi:retinol dehydrogenase-12
MTRTALITGATDGIGLETARQLVDRGFRVILHGRSERRVEEAERSLRAGAANADIAGASADLASMDAVAGLAAQVRELAPALDVLVNNAGVFEPRRVVTVDGFERTMAVNHFAPFLLTRLLLPALTATGRVVNVSSVAHGQAQIDFADLSFERGFSSYRAYAVSKLANILFTVALAQRLGGGGSVANALHPGVISTKLLAAGFGMAGDTVQRGARTSVYLASSPEAGAFNGLYFDDCKPVPPSAAARNPENAARLWTISEQALQRWL